MYAETKKKRNTSCYEAEDIWTKYLSPAKSKDIITVLFLKILKSRHANSTKNPKQE